MQQRDKATQDETRRDETQRAGAGADDQPIAQVNYDCKSTSQVSQDNNKLHTLSVSPSPSVVLSLAHTEMLRKKASSALHSDANSDGDSDSILHFASSLCFFLSLYIYKRPKGSLTVQIVTH